MKYCVIVTKFEAYDSYIVETIRFDYFNQAIKEAREKLIEYPKCDVTIEVEGWEV